QRYVERPTVVSKATSRLATLPADWLRTIGNTLFPVDKTTLPFAQSAFLTEGYPPVLLILGCLGLIYVYRSHLWQDMTADGWLVCLSLLTLSIGMTALLGPLMYRYLYTLSFSTMLCYGALVSALYWKRLRYVIWFGCAVISVYNAAQIQFIISNRLY